MSKHGKMLEIEKLIIQDMSSIHIKILVGRGQVGIYWSQVDIGRGSVCWTSRIYEGVIRVSRREVLVKSSNVGAKSGLSLCDDKSRTFQHRPTQPLQTLKWTRVGKLSRDSVTGAFSLIRDDGSTHLCR